MATKIKGYKTLIVGAILVLYAVCAWLGIVVPEPDGEGALAVSGVLMLALRLLTDGPVGKS